MKPVIRGLRSALIVTLLTILGCSPKSGDQLISPAGWVKETIQGQPSGIEVLFSGKRTEGGGAESHLVVLHAPAMTTKQGARGTIGAFLDGFWRKDPNLFKAIKVSELEIASRHALFVQISGNALNPPQQANWQTYFFMTEAGLYQITYSSQSEAAFRLDELLGKSLVIGESESSFARDVIADYLKSLPEIQAKQP